MSTSTSSYAAAALRKDYLRLKTDPVPYISAAPLPSNILEWHYVIGGAEETPYEGGYYHGKLVFPSEYPFRGPAIYMITPNGRFKTLSKLCLSISDQHPESWSPAWNVSTILMGLQSFMNEDNTSSKGSIHTSTKKKRQLAFGSLEFNLKNPQFCELFPDIVEKIQEQLDKHNSQCESTEEQNKKEVETPC